jgi:hypothetical protein
VDHINKKFGEKATVKFTNEEIAKVLSQFNLTYELLNFFENPNMEYNDYIYKYLESRCHVLLVFNTDVNTSHVVPILGHTLNSDMWSPEAETAYSPPSRLDLYKSASAWVDHFIIHDDNFGMYSCLPVNALKRVTLPKYDPTFRANYAVAIKPSDVTTTPREAEWACLIVTDDMLKRRNNIGQPVDIWTGRLIERLSKMRPIVLRTFLITKNDYLKTLETKDFEWNAFTDRDKQELIKDLPDRFWLSEITLPDLYTANKHKIIDFFYGCNHSKWDNDNQLFERWLQIRFPFVLIKRKANNAITSSPVAVKSHCPLIRFESEQDILDW